MEKQTMQIDNSQTFRNIFKCECGNHESFTSLEKATAESILDSNCGFCQKRTIMEFVKSEVQN